MAPLNFHHWVSCMVAFLRFHGHLLGDGQFYPISAPIWPPAGPKRVKYLNIGKTDGTIEFAPLSIMYGGSFTFLRSFVRRWAVLPHFSPHLTPISYLVHGWDGRRTLKATKVIERDVLYTVSMIFCWFDLIISVKFIKKLDELLFSPKLTPFCPLWLTPWGVEKSKKCSKLFGKSGLMR